MGRIGGEGLCDLLEMGGQRGKGDHSRFPAAEVKLGELRNIRRGVDPPPSNLLTWEERPWVSRWSLLGLEPGMRQQGGRVKRGRSVGSAGDGSSRAGREGRLATDVLQQGGRMRLEDWV